MTSHHLRRVERPSDGVALLVLDNPDQRNAMSDAMTEAWSAAVADLAGDPTVRAVVVTGEGSAFCSGGDTSWIASEPDATVDDLRRRMLPFYRAWLAIRSLEVPTIAAVNGAAIGAGLCLALACDIRYAATSARLGVPFVKLGMHPGMAATWSLPEVVGPAAARDLLLTGRLVGGGRGAPPRVWSPGSSTTRRSSTRCSPRPPSVAATAPIATRLTKLALADGGHATYDAALQWEALAQPVTLATEDLQEGIRAAREKRAPAFRGR